MFHLAYRSDSKHILTFCDTFCSPEIYLLVEQLRPEKALFPANCEERPILTFFDTLGHN